MSEHQRYRKDPKRTQTEKTGQLRVSGIRMAPDFSKATLEPGR